MKKLIIIFLLLCSIMSYAQTDSCYILIGYYGKEHNGTVQFIAKDFPSKKEMTKRVEFVIPNEDFIISSVSIFTKKQWYAYIRK